MKCGIINPGETRMPIAPSGHGSKRFSDSTYHIDRVRQTVRCENCGRILAKIDSDGTVHIKPQKGPEIIASKDSKLMFCCEHITYFTTRSKDDPRTKHPTAKIINSEKDVLSYTLVCDKRTMLYDGKVQNV